ncbi:MAG: polyhydroxyalkanoate synthesis regulator DNA-binding domain-containing protein, partial [Halomonas sp.]|nr:polyhydroxyalkanoate synthesis regulator DNA-binding domain-containing protein [Halomonas sp.]
MRVIRKYANRRLYDTEQSRYVTLEDLRKLILDEVPFRVEDAKSGEDLTRTILLS